MGLIHTEISSNAKEKLDELDEDPDFIGWLLSNALKLGPPAYKRFHVNNLIVLQHIGGWAFIIRWEEDKDTITLLDLVLLDDQIV